MTGLASSFSALMPAAPEYSAPIGPTQSGAPMPANALGALSSNLNLASMSASLFKGASSAYSADAEANQRAQANTNQAADANIQAKQAMTAGQQGSNMIVDNMVQTLAAQRLAFSANGMDLNFGTPISDAASTQKLADTQVSINNSNAALTALQRRKQAAAYLEQASNTRSSGDMTAASDLVGGGVNALLSSAQLAQRGASRG